MSGARLERGACVVERHRLATEGRAGGGDADGQRLIFQLGYPDDRRGRGALQPDVLPQWLGVAT